MTCHFSLFSRRIQYLLIWTTRSILSSNVSKTDARRRWRLFDPITDGYLEWQTRINSPWKRKGIDGGQKGRQEPGSVALMISNGALQWYPVSNRSPQ